MRSSASFHRAKGFGGYRRAIVRLVALAWMPLIGCSALKPQVARQTPDELRAMLAKRLPGQSPSSIVVPHEISASYVDDARIFVQEHLPPKSTVEDRVRALLQLLSSPTGFALRYEWAATRSADDTIDQGGGSCLSLSAVLIGLARGLGIEAYYVDASNIASDKRKDGEVTVHSGHIAVLLVYRRNKAFVDFAGEITDGTHSRRLEDAEIVAHYYNNRGYELIHNAQVEKRAVPWNDALVQFRIAAKVSPTFALAWNNVGLALARLDRNKEALLAFRHALTLNPSLEAASANIDTLTERDRMADVERAYAKTKSIKWKSSAAPVNWKIRRLE
ncbi:MAG: hypothetical protein AAFN74_25500 [Myxococcota bacterium]